MNEQQPDPTSLPKRLGALWLTYLKGQLVLALCVGLVTWVINAGIGLSYPLLLGIVTGLLEPIPSFGPLLAAIPAVIVALWKGSSVIAVPAWAFALIVAGIYVLIQQLASFYLEPRIMGHRLNLPPLVVLISVLVGAALGNVLGAVLAVPVVASLREIRDHFAKRPPAAR